MESRRVVDALAAELWAVESSPQQRRHVVELLAESGNAWALPTLVRLVLDPDLSRVASAGVEHVLSACDPAQLPSADAAVRARSEWADPWTQHARHVGSWWSRRRALGDRGWLLAAALQRDGHLREHALSRLGRHIESNPVPVVRVVLLRLNDWVEQVRIAAQRALWEATEAAPPEAWAVSLPLVRRLYVVGRLTSPDLPDRLIEHVAATGEAALRGALRHPHRSVRSSVAATLLTRPTDDVAREVLDSALDPLPRRWAAEAILIRDPAPAVMEALAADRMAEVRLAAVAHALRDMNSPMDLLESALLDESRRVRDLAQFHARKRGVDPALVYRRAMDTSEPSTAAVAGLGEAGAREDADLVAPYVRHERARIRRAAVEGLARLAPHDHQGLIMGALEDETRSVSRTARVALQRPGARVSADALGRLLWRAEQPEHVVQNVLLALDHTEKWTALTVRLETLPNVPEGLRPLAIERISKLATDVGARLFTQPDAATRARLLEALRQAEPSLPDELRTTLGAVRRRVGP